MHAGQLYRPLHTEISVQHPRTQMAIPTFEHAEATIQAGLGEDIYNTFINHSEEEGQAVEAMGGHAVKSGCGKKLSGQACPRGDQSFSAQNSSKALLQLLAGHCYSLHRQ